MNRMNTFVGWRAALGAAVWIAMLGYVHPLPSHVEWAQMLLLLAALVLVPGGMEIIARPPQSRPEGECLRLIRLIQLPGAIALGIAFLLPQGIGAALLACCWLLVTLLAAMAGVCRLWNHTPRTTSDLCVACGMIYLAVGGGWGVLSRAGLRPLEFEHTIVLLTAIHFHYAGFLLPLLTGLSIRNRSDHIARAASIGVVAGVPLVAVGCRWNYGIAAWFRSVAGKRLRLDDVDRRNFNCILVLATRA